MGKTFTLVSTDGARCEGSLYRCTTHDGYFRVFIASTVMSFGVPDTSLYDLLHFMECVKNKDGVGLVLAGGDEEKFIKENKLAEPTGNSVRDRDGFIYCEYRFNLDLIPLYMTY